MASTFIPGTLFAFGINHKTAPVDVRERLYLSDSEIRDLLDRASQRVSECLVISTCNRTEIFGVSETGDVDVQFFKSLLVDVKNYSGQPIEDDHFFALISCAACQQLFNIATSIDSKIVGDSQILRQLRNAYQIASEHGSTGKILNQLTQRAFKLGKNIYRETSIHDGAVSVSLAAVALATETLGSLRRKTALVIGAGETARLTAEALLNKHIGKLIVTNRSRANAEEMVASLESGETSTDVVDFDVFKRGLPGIDIIISSTGSEEPILDAADLAEQIDKTLVIDIAVPRDVDPSAAEVENVILRNIDDLNSIINENQERRLSDLPKVHRMITKEMVDFLTWYYLLPIMPSYEKGRRPTPEQRSDFVRAKEMLNRHLPEIHKLATQAGGDFRQDLESHLSLVRKLQLASPA